MILGNTPNSRNDFFLEQNKSFAFTMRFHLKEIVNGVHVPYDLTSSVVRMVVEQPARFGGADVIQAFAYELDAELGLVQFRLQAADLDLEPAEYPYDITLLSSNGYSTPVLKGNIVIGSNTDADASNIYSFASPGLEFGVEIHNGATVEVSIDNPDFLMGPPGRATGLFIQPDEPDPEGDGEYTYPLWVDTDADEIGVGPPGPAGPTGPQGPPGTGLEVKGVVANAAALPGSATTGDGYITADNGHLHIWNGSGWTDAGPVVGPAGPTGPAGPAGADGATGPAGPAGPAGPTGPTGPAGSGVSPTGTIVMYGGVTAPSGWLLCDGTPVSRETYSALWGVIGAAFGSGDGINTFNLPDLQNKFPLGAGSRAIGNTGGAETVALATANLPSHSHGLNNHTHATPNHTHTGSATGGAHVHPIDLDKHDTATAHIHEGTTAASSAPGTGGTTNPATPGVIGSNGTEHTHSVTIVSGGGGNTLGNTGVTTSTGSGTAHENMPPFQVVNYIIKA